MLFLKPFDHLLLPGKNGKILHHGDLAADFAEQCNLLQGGVPAADDRHVLPRIKGSVTNGAEGQAVSNEVLLPGKVQPAVPGSGGKNNGSGFVAPALPHHGLGTAILNGGDGVHVHLRTQRHGLFQHFLRQGVAADFREPRVVFQLGRKGDLTAECVLFQHQHGLSRPPGIDGGGESGRSRADNHNIIHRAPQFPWRSA